MPPATAGPRGRQKGPAVPRLVLLELILALLVENLGALAHVLAVVLGRSVLRVMAVLLLLGNERQHFFFFRHSIFTTFWGDWRFQAANACVALTPRLSILIKSKAEIS